MAISVHNMTERNFWTGQSTFFSVLFPIPPLRNLSTENWQLRCHTGVWQRKCKFLGVASDSKKMKKSVVHILT